MANFLFGDEGIIQVDDVLEALTEGLKEGQSIKFDNSGGAFMAVYVNRLTRCRFSVSHYYEANGDLCPDPDMEFVFIEATKKWMPVNFSMPGHFQRCLELDGDDRPTHFKMELLQQLCDFAGMWMTNIRNQQGGLEAIRGAVRKARKGT